MAEAIRTKSEKLREHQFSEGFARSLEGEGVEWDRDNNVEINMGAGKTGNSRKCKRSVWLSESRGKEPNECVVEG